jgi:hypothetical protein
MEMKLTDITNNCDNLIKERIEYMKLNCGNSFVIDELEELLKGE